MKYALPLLLSLFASAASAAPLEAPTPTLSMGQALTAEVVGAVRNEGVQGVADVLVFDSFTGATTLTTTTGSPRTFMGFPFDLGGAGGSNPMINRATVYLAYTGSAAQTYSTLRLRIQLWDTWSSAATPVFSAAKTLIEADVPGPVTLSPNTFSSVAVTFPTPIALTGLTGHGVTFNIQGDTGAGLASADALTTLLRAGPPVAVGTPLLPPTQFGYRNASGRTDFNFVPGDARGFTGLDNQGTAAQLFALPAPLISQSITSFVATPTSPVLGDGSFTVSATGGPSGNPVVFSIDASSSAVCSAGGTNGATIAILTAGNCIVLADQAGNATHSAAAQESLTVTIRTGNLTITPASVAFGDQVVGSTSAASTVTLANTGNASLQVTALTAAAAPFTRVGGTCANSLPITIADGTSCTLTYAYAPTATGASSQVLTVTANAPGSGAITLSGTGVQGNLTITPAAIAFGDQAVGTTSVASTVTLANTGNASLQVTALTVASAPFALSGGTCGALPITITAGGDCTLAYTFSPTVSGAVNQTLTVTANAPGGGVIALSGTGDVGVIGVLSASVNYGAVTIGQVNTQAVTITNTGTSPLQVTGISPVSAPFALVAGGTCSALPITINAGDACTVRYAYTPTAPQVSTQTVDIVSNGGTVSVTLRGNGFFAATMIPTTSLLAQLLLLMMLGGVALLAVRRH